MTSIAAVLKAQALAAAIGEITGTRPIVTDTGTSERISFSPADQVQVREWIEGQLKSAKLPADVEIDYLPIVAPIAIKKLWPAVLALIAAGYLLGKL